MFTFTRYVGPAIAALIATSGIAHAQTAQNVPAPQQSQQPSPGQRQPLSADAMERMHDGRIAMIKGALKMTDAQLKLWGPVETQLRARQASHAKMRQDHSASQQTPGAQSTLPDRLERRTARQAQRAEQDKTFTEALKPFFAALTEDQRVVADRLLADKGGNHHGGNHHGGAGHGMHGGRTL